MKDMADRMAADGFKDAGYEYVIVDDCWPAHNRTAQGQLQPDPQRFPSGIKALSDYVCKFMSYQIYHVYCVFSLVSDSSFPKGKINLVNLLIMFE